MNLIINTHSISQDKNGFFSLNDLHKASGNENRHTPALFLRNQQTQDLICAIESENQIAYHTVKGGDSKTTKQGTFVCREIVIAYACWISAHFHLSVLRAFDNLNTGAIPCLPKTTAQQRQALVTACDKLAVGNTLRSDIYKMVGNQFGVDDIQSIPMHQLADATAFVYEIILAKQQTPKTPELPQKTIERLASQFAKTAELREQVKKDYLPFLENLNQEKGEKLSSLLTLLHYDIQDNVIELLKMLPLEAKNKNNPIYQNLERAYHENTINYLLYKTY